MNDNEIEEVIKGLEIQTGRVCVRCGERKPLTDFYCRSDGYHFTSCKGCERKHRKEHNTDRNNYLAKKARGWKRVRCGERIEWRKAEIQASSLVARGSPKNFVSPVV